MDFLHCNTTPKYTVALLYVVVQQHYAYLCSSITHAYAAALHIFAEQYYLCSNVLHLAVLFTPQHYTYTHSITLISAAALHTPTPLRSTHIHSNSITHTYAIA